MGEIMSQTQFSDRPASGGRQLGPDRVRRWLPAEPGLTVLLPSNEATHLNVVDLQVLGCCGARSSCGVPSLKSSTDPGGETTDFLCGIRRCS